MASCGDSQNGGRYPARFDSGSTSGFSEIPRASAMKERRAHTRCHIPGYREASSARSAASASATPSSMFEVWYTVPVAGMMSTCSAIPDCKETGDPAYTGELGHSSRWYDPGHVVAGAELVGAAAAGQGEVMLTRAAQGQLDRGPGGVPDGAGSSARVGVGHRHRIVVGGYGYLQPGVRRGEAGREPVRACVDLGSAAQPAERDPLPAQADRAHRGPRRPDRADPDPGQH